MISAIDIERSIRFFTKVSSGLRWIISPKQPQDSMPPYISVRLTYVIIVKKSNTAMKTGQRKGRSFLKRAANPNAVSPMHIAMAMCKAYGCSLPIPKRSRNCPTVKAKPLTAIPFRIPDAINVAASTSHAAFVIADIHLESPTLCTELSIAY